MIVRVARYPARNSTFWLVKYSPPPLNLFLEGAVMRLHRIASCVAAFALFLFAETSASAQGTEQQRQACTPDVFRLCGAYIPDADRITACLRASGPQLSRPCHEVFFPTRDNQQQDRSQNLQPQNIDPRRRYQPPPRDRYRDPYDPYDDEN